MSVRMKVMPLAETGRLDALHRTGLLDSPPEEPFDRLTHLVCRVLRVPVSLVSLVDADRQFFKSQRGLPEPWSQARQTPLSHSFCQHVVTRREPLVIENASNDPLVCNNAAISDLGVAAYLGVPLTTPEGHVLGSLCAISTEPKVWSEDDLLTLQDIAHAVMGEINLRSENALRRQSEEQLALLGQELTHRIKNLFAVTSSLVAISAKRATSPQEVVAAVRERLSALSTAHDYVTQRSSEDPQVDGSTLGGLFRVLLAAYPQDQIEIGTCDQFVGPRATQAVALIFHELATNAVKYGALSSPEGHVTINCDEEAGALTIAWVETGGPALHEDPQTQGFGSSLAERITRSHLGGDLQRAWLPTGLKLSIRVGADRLLS